mmetsp:Transcript_4455/g.16309  ORF Transcript_4455/g.16309 Transcript_4455/m.16309 type:complete len:356 (+) Transcript_4455:1268-2335(+)
MHSSASAFHVRFLSSSSTPSPIVALTIARHVAMEGGSDFSAISASLIQLSRSIVTPCDLSDLTARAMILSIIFSLPLASSSLAAVIQICGSRGRVSRALFNTFLAFSHDSKRANASQRSTCCGQHSVARASKTRASSSGLNSTSAFHKRTELGTFSNARRKTRRLRSSSSSSCAACIQIFTEFGSACTPRAKIALPFSGVFKRAASIHTSSFFGHASHPFCINTRACCNFPANSSKRAAAIQPGACFGFVLITLLSNNLAFLISEISAALVIFCAPKSVKYPLGSIVVCPVTESLNLSSFNPSTVPRPSPTAVKSCSPPFSSASALVVSFSASALANSVSGAGMNPTFNFFFLIV